MKGVLICAGRQRQKTTADLQRYVVVVSSDIVAATWGDDKTFCNANQRFCLCQLISSSEINCKLKDFSGSWEVNLCTFYLYKRLNANLLVKGTEESVNGVHLMGLTFQSMEFFVVCIPA